MLFRANVAINLIILTTFQECGISRLKALGDEILLWYKILVLAFLGYALIWRRNEMRMDSFWLMIWNQFMLFFYANLSMVGQVGHLNIHWEDLEKREVQYCLLLMLRISYKIWSNSKTTLNYASTATSSLLTRLIWMDSINIWLPIVFLYTVLINKQTNKQEKKGHIIQFCLSRWWHVHVISVSWHAHVSYWNMELSG